MEQVCEELKYVKHFWLALARKNAIQDLRIFKNILNQSASFLVETFPLTQECNHSIFGKKKKEKTAHGKGGGGVGVGSTFWPNDKR